MRRPEPTLAWSTGRCIEMCSAGDWRLCASTQPTVSSADVIAYGVPPGGGGHDHRVALVGTTLIVTPGSPNLPVRHGTVARLTFTENVDVEIVHLPT